MSQEEINIHTIPRIYIANFGIANYLWPDCLTKSTVATFELQATYPFTTANDKEGYVAYSLANVKTARGNTPTLAVASRWYNVCKIIESTCGDLWLHRADNLLWWTISEPGPVSLSHHSLREPAGNNESVVHLHKPAKRWQSTNLKGKPLIWEKLHPKAKAFLILQGTLRQLSPENAAYARALILGEDLSPWHKLERWKKYVQLCSPEENAAFRMALTAWETTEISNGQQVQRTIKNKDFKFASRAELEQYVLTLIYEQEGLCALSGLDLQYDGLEDDRAMLASLDRIDSSKHYEPGNLQVVCSFLNKWKSAQDDSEFRRLLAILRQ